MCEFVKNLISFTCFSSMSLRKECVLSTKSVFTDFDLNQRSGEIMWNLYAECGYRPQGVRRQSL
jgi:hypothetical protein